MLDLTDFAVQERPEGNLMVAISRPWYNCSYTMAAKPIKSLELHYTMMQFLIIPIIPLMLVGYEMIIAKSAPHVWCTGQQCGTKIFHEECSPSMHFSNFQKDFELEKIFYIHKIHLLKAFSVFDKLF